MPRGLAATAPLARSSARVALALAIAVAALPRPASAEAAADEVAARDERARQLFEAGDNAAALDELEAAQALAPAAPRLYNMARCADALGEGARARELYAEYLASDEALPDRARIARERLAALDAAEPPPVEAVASGPSEEEAPPTPPVRPRRDRLEPAAFYAMVGVTGAAALATAILGGLALAANDEFQGLLREDPRVPELAAQGRSLTIGADVALGLAAASAATALVLALLTDFHGPTVAASATGLAVSGRF